MNVKVIVDREVYYFEYNVLLEVPMTRFMKKEEYEKYHIEKYGIKKMGNNLRLEEAIFLYNFKREKKVTKEEFIQLFKDYCEDD